MAAVVNPCPLFTPAHLMNMQGLALREAQLAVAAGTNAMLLCGTSNAICQLQALSPAGRCRTLDAGADG